MSSSNTFNIRADIKPANEGGRRVVALAKSYVGTVESPANTYTGVDVDRWNAYFSANAIAWAGSFATAMYWESEVWDGGIGDPNPIIMFQRAFAEDRVSPIGFPGCFVVVGTFSADRSIMLTARTVEIFVQWQDVEQRQAVCIGGCVDIGGTNRGVKIQYRNIALPDINDPLQRALFLVPKSVSLREATIERTAV